MTSSGVAQANKTLIRSYLDLYNGGSLAIADEIIDGDFVDHVHEDLPPGPQSVKDLVASVHAAFPDVRFSVEDVVAEGDLVAIRWTMRGTHQGPFAGVGPTSREVVLTGMDFVRIRDGKFAELWSNQDTLGLLLALGAVTRPDRPSVGLEG
jgi:predicted ester cyclase